MGLYQWRLMISLAAARDYLDGQSTVACGGRTTRRPAQWALYGAGCRPTAITSRA